MLDEIESRKRAYFVAAADRDILKNLCTRAADALEEEFGSPTDPAYGVKGPIHELIAKLRHAVLGAPQ